MSIGMNVTAARVARPGEARPFVPLAEAVGTRAMPFELFAVREHPADYPTAVPVTSYMETVAVDLRIDSACLAPQRPQPRQKTAPGDELRIVLSFPPPPLEMALDVNIRAADANLLISRSLALTPAAGSRPAELVYSDTLDEAGMDGDRFRVVLRIPATTVLISGNPESLVGSELVVECVSSRQVARYARFGRFLDVAASSRAMVGDDRPTARRAAGALVYPLLYKMLLPALVDQQLDSSALDERVRLAARELTRQAGSLDILRHQAWSVVASSDAGQLDYARALIRAEEAFRLAPDDPASQHIFGAALYRTGDYDAAVEVLERSLASSDEYEISKTAFLAMSEWRRGRLTAARDLLGRLGPASSMPLGARPNAREAEELVLGAPRPLADQSSLPGGS
jgi:tetratricopeptide (TPR) repeat protein